MSVHATMIYLRELREFHGLSQADIGQVLKVDPKQIHRWETGKNLAPATAIAAIANAVKARSEHVTKLLLLSGEARIDEAVARGYARDRITELSIDPCDDSDRARRLELITARLRAHPRSLDLWLGYGERLADEAPDSA